MPSVIVVALGGVLLGSSPGPSAAIRPTRSQDSVRMASDVKTLGSLLAKEGREHLTVRAEGKQLLVSSIGEDGQPHDHLRFSPDPSGYRVERFDGQRWVPAPISGSLAACVNALVDSGVGPSSK
jgi:hypothetical protein